MGEQVQAKSKSALQNRLALALLPAEAHGVCGYVKLDAGHRCLHVPNATEDLQKQVDEMQRAASRVRRAVNNRTPSESLTNYPCYNYRCRSVVDDT